MNRPEVESPTDLQIETHFGVTKPERGLFESATRQYRPDIDGLRAIAIVLVILSHLGIKATAGGFVGVDIFFVISGYLLTGNIADSISAGRFSVARFYERRIRRIVPALVVVLFGTSVLAYFVFPSKALALFGQSLLAALFSYANLYFFTQPDGYFSLTFTKLLLHTWSLGVEEQFYVVLPLCMLWASRRPVDATRVVVGVLAATSFALAVYFTFVDRTFAFYMPYTRAWELLIGSALALRIVPAPTSRLTREAMAGAGIAVIICCLLLYTESTPFPGLAALPPCLAAAMLLSAAERGRTTASAFLRWPPVVFIGVISYSLYLWHWPVILFLRLGILPKLDYGPLRGLTLMSVLLSFVLATISWRFIERPFRTGRWKSMSRKQVFLISGFSAGALSLVALTFVFDDGMPKRFPPNANLVGNYLFGDSTRRPGCFVEKSFADFDAPLCLAGERRRKRVLLLGDSHADALWYGLARSMPNADVLQATGSSCPPTKGNYDRSPCGLLRRFIYEAYLPKHVPDMVILTEAWKSVSDIDALEPALAWMKNRHVAVVVVGPVPEYSAPLPLLLALAQKWNRPALPKHRLLRNLGNLDRELASRVSGRMGLHYASIWQALCTDSECRQYVDSEERVPMLFDSNHLTPEGAVLAVRRLQALGQLSL